MLMRRGSDPTVLYKTANRIAENMDRADQMIRDLLDTNRIEAGQRLSIEIAECDLVQITKDTLEELAIVHGDRFVLKMPETLRGHWSSAGIKRILENLCTNAIKYGAQDRPVTVSLNQESDRVVLSVQNWGNPISAKEQVELFKAYHRTESAQSGKQKGWGLGLTLVKGLAEAHGGSVAVESTLESGTTFTVTLPLESSHQPDRRK
jgi:signal transduction histidine kinase